MTNIIHWKELNGNKFLTKFHPFMLSEDGYLLQRTVGSRRTSDMQKAYVLFDRSYVLEVLKSHFELLEIDIDEACDLASESMLLLEQGRDSKKSIEHDVEMYEEIAELARLNQDYD